MNKRRLAAIAKWLEAGAPHRKGVDGFNMAVVREETDCGTFCCIAGAAKQWWPDSREARANPEKFPFVGQSQLGLTNEDAESLFTPNGYYIGNHDASWAARVIRKLIATGEVDWEGTREASA